MGSDQIAAHDPTTNKADSCARGATTAVLNARRKNGRAESHEAGLVDPHQQGSVQLPLVSKSEITGCSTSTSLASAVGEPVATAVEARIAELVPTIAIREVMSPKEMGNVTTRTNNAQTMECFIQAPHNKVLVIAVLALIHHALNPRPYLLCQGCQYQPRYSRNDRLSYVVPQF